MTERRVFVMALVMLAVIAAGPGWALSAQLLAAPEEVTSFVAAGTSVPADDDVGFLASWRRSGPPSVRAVSEPAVGRTVVTAAGVPVLDAPTALPLPGGVVPRR